MTLTDGRAGTLVAVAAVLVALWGAQVSVRSALRGPGWALGHLRSSFLVGMAAMLFGIGIALLVTPAWFGYGLFYLAAVVAWISWTVSRGLQRVRALGEFGQIPSDRQVAILDRTARWLLIGAAVLCVVAVIDLAWRGWPALVDLGLVAVLAGTGLVTRRRASAIGSDGS